MINESSTNGTRKSNANGVNGTSNGHTHVGQESMRDDVEHDSLKMAQGLQD